MSLLWLIGGAAGIIGAFTGPMAKWIGMKWVYWLSQCCLAVPLLLLAFSHHYSVWLFPAVALGGAAYVTLSGVLLVWGAECPRHRRRHAVLILATGQVIGSLLFGQLYAQAGASTVLILFAALPLLVMLIIRR
ncbi:hypothetical protein [uncultured Pantoea sp.]|uniref:hypothetical protein n=1 Tax=uncultured Pantoea sp. TaxID=218084 RepID=UPI0025F3A6E6|nr:hypothetical protein [uncultured Pantoea sp.]